MLPRQAGYLSHVLLDVYGTGPFAWSPCLVPSWPYQRVVTPRIHCCKALRIVLVCFQVDLHCGWLEEILVGREESSPRHFDEVGSPPELRFHPYTCYMQSCTFVKHLAFVPLPLRICPGVRLRIIQSRGGMVC